MTPTITYTERRDQKFGGWYQEADVDGQRFYLGVMPGKRVRIPYKPRGTYGVQWHGFVRDAKGATLWSGRVNGSTGARWLLEAAEVVPLRPSEYRKAMGRLHFEAILEDEARTRELARQRAEVMARAHNLALLEDARRTRESARLAP